MLQCIEKTLVYYPANLRVLFMKGYILNALIRERLYTNKGIADDYVRILDCKIYELEERVKELGWTKESEEVLKRLDDEAEQITRQEQAKMK